jgi:hypothetical protein
MIANEPFRGINEETLEHIRSLKTVHSISSTQTIVGIGAIIIGFAIFFKYPQIKAFISGLSK